LVFEELVTNPAVQAGLMVVGRNLIGWFQTSLKDGKISSYEWKLLGETALKMGLISVFAYFGLNGVGIDMNAAESTALAGLVDVLRSTFKKK
jgi:hypothetical protein